MTAILDWEYAGWYPEHWEYIKVLGHWRPMPDLSDYLPHILPPRCEREYIYRHDLLGSYHTPSMTRPIWPFPPFPSFFLLQQYASRRTSHATCFVAAIAFLLHGAICRNPCGSES